MDTIALWLIAHVLSGGIIYISLTLDEIVAELRKFNARERSKP